MTRDEGEALLRQYVREENMIRHSLASEAVLRALARRLSRDEDEWGLAGLLHDIDIELVNGDLSVHGMEAARILEENGLSPAVVDAVRMHNEMSHGQKRTTEFQFALAAGETITGLITATALVYPDKKIAPVKPSSVVKRMKEKAFAASVNRDTIRECEHIGIPLAEFAEISVAAMKEISDRIGL